MHRHAFAFSFSAHFFVICCCSKLLVFFLLFRECKHKPTSNVLLFAYFDFDFFLSNMLNSPMPNPIVPHCKFFYELRSVKIHLHVIGLVV